MKKKTVSSIISKKMKSWLNSIDDQDLRRDVQKDIIVSGGCITSMLLDEKINDFDIYLKTIDSAKRVAAYYVAQYKKLNPEKISAGDINVFEKGGRIEIRIKSAGISGENTDETEYRYFEQLDDAQGISASTYVQKAFGSIKDETESDDKESYRPVFLSQNAITLSDKIQIIIRFYGDPEEIHKNFDFVHCTNYWTFSTGVVTNKEAMESLLAKELVYTGSRYPLCSIFRSRKFLKRGFTITAGQYLKMAMQLQELDLKDIEVLEDQLVGVDVAYFHELIEKLKEHNPKEVDTTYLMSIIDEMF